MDITVETKSMKQLIKEIRLDIIEKLNQFNGDHKVYDKRTTDMKSIKRKLYFTSKKM